MEWIKTKDQLPPFDKLVLVGCRIYGRFLATYVKIGDFEGVDYGNWRDSNGNLGILPPVCWCEIPEMPEIENEFKTN